MACGAAAVAGTQAAGVAACAKHFPGHGDSTVDSHVGVPTVGSDLAGALKRFEGYSARYDAALRSVLEGEHHWVDGIEVDSCHLVWMQLHEDLIASLGLDRSAR